MFVLLFFLILPIVALVIVIVAAHSEGRGASWQFQMGRVIANSFSAIGTAPWVILGTSMLAMGVPNLVLGLAGPGLGDSFWSMTLARSGGHLLAWAVVGQLGQLFVIGVALSGLAGERPDYRMLLARSLRQLPAAIAVAILTTVAVFAGLLVLVVPGLILLVCWSLAVPAIAAENLGPFAALARSVRLSAGARWRMLLLLLIAGAGWLFASIVASVLTVALQGLAGQFGGAFANALIDSVTGVMAPMGLAAMYHELRTGKEGASGRQQLETVFA